MMEDMPETEDAVISAIGDILSERLATLAVAESLTGGELSARFACAEGSSEWYRGGVVAYASEVKHALLDVPDGPVVSEVAVTAMAEHVADLLGADVAVSVSGVAGPAAQDDQPPGTVWLAVRVGGRTHTRLEHFAGDPPDIVEATMRGASAWLLALLNDAS
jgi:nicotinamide-nucleotide amidase